MSTNRQINGNWGEKYVRSQVDCPKCKSQNRSFRALRVNFAGADLICDFCGYLAQVKLHTKEDVAKCPKSLPGAGWDDQKERMDAGIFTPIFIVVANSKKSKKAIYFLPADLQTEEMFVPGKPLPKRPTYRMTTIKFGLATCFPIKIR
ncbi:MAG: hypothetical protein HY050_09015 [Actinobacteria bacterium]|nr:hypothetical protein [Actinomycetota bacterium]